MAESKEKTKTRYRRRQVDIQQLRETYQRLDILERELALDKALLQTAIDRMDCQEETIREILNKLDVVLNVGELFVHIDRLGRAEWSNTKQRRTER